VSGANEAWKTIIRVNIDRHHQIETQQRQVREVILSQTLTAQMSVDASQTAEAINGDTNTFEIGKFNPSIIANHHVFNMAAAIDKRANLPAGLV
jgi:hypothetical protein